MILSEEEKHHAIQARQEALEEERQRIARNMWMLTPYTIYPLNKEENNEQLNSN